MDVYDRPGGEGKPRAEFLKAQSQVYLHGENDHWCQVAGDAVPGDTGGIWCGMGDDGKNYKLTPVTDNTPEPTEPSRGGGGTGQ